MIPCHSISVIVIKLISWKAVNTKTTHVNNAHFENWKLNRISQEEIWQIFIFQSLSQLKKFLFRLRKVIIIIKWGKNSESPRSPKFNYQYRDKSIILNLLKHVIEAIMKNDYETLKKHDMT